MFTNCRPHRRGKRVAHLALGLACIGLTCWLALPERQRRLVEPTARATTTFAVTTTADMGDNNSPTSGSLRVAILKDNAAVDGAINFNIPSRGVHAITPPDKRQQQTTKATPANEDVRNLVLQASKLEREGRYTEAIEVYARTKVGRNSFMS